MPKQPEDHKPAKGEPFRFKAGGKSYVLPSAQIGRDTLSGGDLEDAMLAGELGMAGYAIKCLRASGASDVALAAMRSLPQDEYLKVLKAWGEHGDGDGASLGESLGSDD